MFVDNIKITIASEIYVCRFVAKYKHVSYILAKFRCFTVAIERTLWEAAKCPLRSGRVKIGIPPTKVQYVWADKGGEMARGLVRQCANTLNQKSCNRWSLCQRLPPPPTLPPPSSHQQHLHQKTPPCRLMTTRSSFLLWVRSSLVLILKVSWWFMVVTFEDHADSYLSFNSLYSANSNFSEFV